MLNRLETEQRNPESKYLDEMPVYEVLQKMNEEDQYVTEAVRKVLPAITPLVEAVTKTLRTQGRLIYVGAGTSGRLGLLDAVECRPTFGVPSSTVIGQMAGGEAAFTEAKEGAEDSREAGELDLINLSLTANDAVVGLAASGRTPYVVGALQYARSRGAVTGSVACNRSAVISAHADHPIEVNTGAEVLTGSTRLKAGTAQKLVLNMISTASMVGTGKVYENLMVDVRPTNEKLYKRSHRIIIEATGADEETAVAAFEEAGQHVKTAIVMILADVSEKDARQMLVQSDGFIKKAVRGGD